MTYEIFTQPNCHRCPPLKRYLETAGLEGVNTNAINDINKCASLGVSSTPTVIFYGEMGVEIGRAYDVEGAKKIVEEKSKLPI